VKFALLLKNVKLNLASTLNHQSCCMNLNQLCQLFASILNPSFPDFNHLPAAACLLDPNYGALLFTPDGNILLEPIKSFIINEVGRCCVFVK
jgi:hypothetical protein